MQQNQRNRLPPPRFSGGRGPFADAPGETRPLRCRLHPVAKRGGREPELFSAVLSWSLNRALRWPWPPAFPMSMPVSWAPGRGHFTNPALQTEKPAVIDATQYVFTPNLEQKAGSYVRSIVRFIPPHRTGHGNDARETHDAAFLVFDVRFALLFRQDCFPSCRRHCFGPEDGKSFRECERRRRTCIRHWGQAC